jgi:hypothetical protein
MFLIQLLRRRGLTLQSSKTEILNATDAKHKIEGVIPVIQSAEKRYRERILELLKNFDPYAPLHTLEEEITSEDAPLEVLQEIFDKYFINSHFFSRSLFHFLLNRFGNQKVHLH